MDKTIINKHFEESLISSQIQNIDKDIKYKIID